MEKKFTPGPWEVSEGNAGSIFGDLNNGFWKGDNPYIGKVAGFGYDEELDDESKANAALISAAPDLLEALEACLAFIEEIKAHGISGWSGEESARTAIKKATTPIK